MDDGWVDGQMDGCMDGQMDRWMHGCMDAWVMAGYVDRYMDSGYVDLWLDDRWVCGRIDGQVADWLAGGDHSSVPFMYGIYTGPELSLPVYSCTDGLGLVVEEEMN